MSVYIQLMQINGETLVEFSGIAEISRVYLEDADVNISVACLKDDQKIRLSVKPNNNKIFTPFFFDMQMLAQRMALAQLLNGSKVIIVPKGIDVQLNDIQALKELLQASGGIWLDGLPKESIREIVNCCTC